MTTKNEIKNISKFLSFVLRHEPASIGLTLDDAGWAPTDELLGKAAAAGRPITRELLNDVVATNDKKRFALSADGSRIRANQGHSIDVELGLAPLVPPAVLLHGTATRFVDSILSTGLTKRQRQHVHMSEDIGIARAVGQRYGAVVLLEIDAKAMHAAGHQFFRSDNGVWLTDHVPTPYLKVRP